MRYTWTLTKLPPERKARGCKWVFRMKHDADGEIQDYKARLVVKGYSQKFASKEMQVKHLDMKTAFLHGKDFIEKGKEELTYKLQKSIYGLKQAARAWDSKLNDMLLHTDFKRSESEPCLYTKCKDDK